MHRRGALGTKKFSELKAGEEFFSTCTISKKELESYLAFSRIKNVIFDFGSNENSIVSGRAILARMEGEFTRLSQIYGNVILFYGTDGDKDWDHRNTRFLKPLHTDQVLKIKFTISDKADIDNDYGILSVNYEGKPKKASLLSYQKEIFTELKKSLQGINKEL